MNFSTESSLIVPRAALDVSAECCSVLQFVAVCVAVYVAVCVAVCIAVCVAEHTCESTMNFFNGRPSDNTCLRVSGSLSFSTHKMPAHSYVPCHI